MLKARGKKCAAKNATVSSELPSNEGSLPATSVSEKPAPQFMSGEWLKENLHLLKFKAWNTNGQVHDFGPCKIKSESRYESNWSTIALDTTGAVNYDNVCGIGASIEVHAGYNAGNPSLKVKIYVRDGKSSWRTYREFDMGEELLLEKLSK